MKRATLAFITRGRGEAEEILLGLKKEAEIGTGTINGPGGKVEPGETPLQCVLRETNEEMGIQLDPKKLRLAAIIKFFAAGELDFEVFVYRTRVFAGEPHETSSMFPPEWHKVNNLPLDRMLDGDRKWFGHVIKSLPGPTLEISVYYKKRAKDFEHIEFSNLP